MIRSRGDVVALAALVTVGMALRGSPAWGLDAFAVCFTPAAVRDPDAQTVARVNAAVDAAGGDAMLERSTATLVRALVSHESGGRWFAVSPTGCAGVVAMNRAHLGHVPPCCALDADDHAEYAYDLCNSESRRRYRCDFVRDPRFRPRFALGVAVRRVGALEHRMGGTVACHPPAEVLVPLLWNVGFDPFPTPPAGIGEVFAQIDFRRGRDFLGWNRHALANKLVEIHDYLLWFDHLTRFWAGHERGHELRPPLLCAQYDPASWLTRRSGLVVPGAQGRERIRREFRPLRVKRLEFGVYREDEVLLGESGVLPSDDG